MSTVARLRGADFDVMVERGSFDALEPMKIELIHGGLRFMNPAGPVHDGEIEYLTDWSYANTDRELISVRVQCTFDCGEHRPEPDLLWFRKRPSRRIRPTHEHMLLVIEISDSSLTKDLTEKVKLYAEHDIPEYWVVDIKAEQLRVYRAPSNGQYQSVEVLSQPASVAPLGQPSANLQLSDLFDLDN